jgi:hypothetical protein
MSIAFFSTLLEWVAMISRGPDGFMITSQRSTARRGDRYADSRDGGIEFEQRRRLIHERVHQLVWKP